MDESRTYIVVYLGTCLVGSTLESISQTGPLKNKTTKPVY
jgi:hypothetical protein